jgi:hypothetical protein
MLLLAQLERAVRVLFGAALAREEVLPIPQIR